MDIVERLIRSGSQLNEEAADEIERLRFELAVCRPVYEVACWAGFAEPEEGGCDLCRGRKKEDETVSTIDVELVHEGGMRSLTRVLCPQCKGTGKAHDTGRDVATVVRRWMEDEGA